MKKIFFIIVCLLFVPSSSFSAELFFGSHAKEIGVGEKFEIGVFVNTQDQPVNVVASNISFPKDLFDLEGFYDGNSVISFWMDRPILIANGVINFSGVIPGGINTPRGYLFSLLLRAKQAGDAMITTTSEEILLDDGLGSVASITKAPLSVRVTSAPPQNFAPLYDATPPEVFVPEIGREESIFNGAYFLAFTAQDKQSGVDHYKVKESLQFGSFASLVKRGAWVEAESPYLLNDQSLRSVILVKAVDRAGNERVVYVQPVHKLPWYQNYVFWIIIIAIGCAIVFVKKKIGF